MEKVAKTLVVVDMQNDFVSGSLGSEQAKAIVPAVIQKIRKCREEGYRIVFTRDTHHENYMETREGQYLPVKHCIEGTWGWELCDGMDTTGADVINKPAFGYLGWGEFPSDEFELIGLCTDICVVSNALILKATYPGAVVRVDSHCCAGVTEESHNAALMTMKCCQVETD